MKVAWKIKKTSLMIAALLAGCVGGRALADEVVENQKEVIISGAPEATRLGMEVLKKGGNAADALVTVSLALGIAEPGNSGLGGKMVTLYYDAKTRTVTSIVAMDAAPLKGDVEKMIASADAKKERGWVNTCTPGLAAGLGEIHKRWGTQSWSELVTPAAELAENGVKLSALAAHMLSEYPVGVDAAADRIYAPTGKTLAAGETLRNPDLANILKIMAAKGASSFYSEEIAGKIVAGAQAAGGFMTLDDFKNYKARVLPPVSTDYRGYKVFSSPPPLSGGATLLAALKCLEGENWAGSRPRNDKYIDVVSRVFQQVYPEVTRAAGDTSASYEHVMQILAPGHISGMVERANSADPRNPYVKLQRAAEIAPSQDLFNPLALTVDEPEYASTTHLIIIDRLGNAVCCTQSLGLHFGAAVLAPGTGILLNADINNFSLKTTSSINAIAPGKWPRSTMSPTIFLKNGKPSLVIGSPAGQRIPTAVLQVALDVVNFNRPLAESVRAARFHIRNGGGKSENANRIDLEAQSQPGLENSLKTRGWEVTRRDVKDFYFGSVNAALIKPEGITAVADLRRTADAGGQ